MTPEEREILEKTHELVKENNQLLHRMRIRARMGTALKIFYWVVIIGLSLGAFYFIQPYVDFLTGVRSTSAGDTTSQSYVEQLQDLLK